MATLFTRIIDGDIPGQLVWADDVCAAFLDITPLTRGHVLVVPRAEIDHWLDLDDATRDHLMRVASTVGRAQMAAFSPARIGVIIQGFEVPHAHIHVFGADSAADFDDSDRTSREPEDLARDAEELRAALRDLGPETAAHVPA